MQQSEDGDRAQAAPMTTGQLVVTGWYRAPEVILEAQYGACVDCWSVGCILYEIWQVSWCCSLPDAERKKERKGALFQTKQDEYRELLDAIFSTGILQKPSRGEIEAVKSPNTTPAIGKRNYLLQLTVKQRPPRLLAEKMERRVFPNLIQEVIQGFLTFVPNKRLTMEMALKKLEARESYGPDQRVITSIAVKMKDFQAKVFIASA